MTKLYIFELYIFEQLMSTIVMLNAPLIFIIIAISRTIILFVLTVPKLIITRHLFANCANEKYLTL